MMCGVTPDSKNQAQAQRHCCPQKSDAPQDTVIPARCLQLNFTLLEHVPVCLKYWGQGYMAVLPFRVSLASEACPQLFRDSHPAMAQNEDENSAQPYGLKRNFLSALGLKIWLPQ